MRALARKAPSIIDTLQLPRRESLVSPLLRWLANTRTADPPSVDAALSIALNNVCRAASVSSFKVVATYVYSHLTVELIGLAPGQPRWFYDRLPSRAEVVRQLGPSFPRLFGLEGRTDLREAKEIVSAFRLLQEFDVHDYGWRVSAGEESFTIGVSAKMTLVPYAKGRVCWSIPIPGKPKDTKGSVPQVVTGPEVVIRSPIVAQTLVHLSEIWQDRFVKSVLISAPPGSGKEDFAHSLGFGSGRPTANMSAISLPASSQEALERQLFGFRGGDGSFTEGLISKAANSVLFLDEVHHPEDSAGIRASLLRPLEADEYLPVASSQPESVRNVLFVMATSRRLQPGRGGSGKPLAQIPPKDFWTRMTYALQIDHPLDYTANRAAPYPSVLACFFKFFWWNRTSSFYGVDPSSPPTSAAAPDALNFDHATRLLDETALDKMAKEFARQLIASLGAKRRHVADLSIREIGRASCRERVYVLV